MRCLALFTGGLDSLLAVRLLQDQGCEVHGLYVTMPLCATADHVAAAAKSLDIPLTTASLEVAWCHLVRHPRFGRIEGTAPCLDCRIGMFQQAADLREQIGAEFVISGEVVGQRARSAIKDLEIVAHHSGLEDLLLRPLSGRLLSPTIPEREGWIGATALLSLQGKGRKAQARLAESLGIEVPAPRPDCPLLAAALGGRLNELLDAPLDFGARELELLPIGRHFRIGENAWIVLGRNRAENERLQSHARLMNEGSVITLETLGFRGPVAILWGDISQENCRRAAEMVVRFGRVGDAEAATVVVHGPRGESMIHLSIAAAVAHAEEADDV